MFARVTLTIVLSRNVRNRTVQSTGSTDARAAPDFGRADWRTTRVYPEPPLRTLEIPRAALVATCGAQSSRSWASRLVPAGFTARFAGHIQVVRPVNRDPAGRAIRLDSCSRCAG